MVQHISVFLLAFAVSIDSFSAGFTYGLRKMALPLKSVFIIAGCSAFSMIAAVTAGKALGGLFPEGVIEKAGGMILIGLGAWVLFQFFRPSRGTEPENTVKTIVNFEIKSIGLVIKILKKPLSADFDLSGTITGIEAFMLGMALSLDSFGAGIGASMLGFSPLYLSLAAGIMSSGFVYTGIKAGACFSKWSWLEKFAFLPGLMLICIGVWKL